MVGLSPGVEDLGLSLLALFVLCICLNRCVCGRIWLESLGLVKSSTVRGTNFSTRRYAGRAFERLLRALVRVNSFVSQQFFQNTTEDRLELHSKLIDQKRYERYVKGLKNLIRRTRDVYRNYRMTVKQELKV